MSATGRLRKEGELSPGVILSNKEQILSVSSSADNDKKKIMTINGRNSTKNYQGLSTWRQNQLTSVLLRARPDSGQPGAQPATGMPG